MGELSYTAAFYGLAVITLAAASGVIFKRNLVHSALCLALTFMGVAGLYILLEADFLAAVQILVYTGAIAVMLVIGVMLTQRPDMTQSNPGNNLMIPAALVTGALLAVAGWAIVGTRWEAAPAVVSENSLAVIAKVLFRDYAVPFEAVAVLLLVALIGAVTLAKGADDK